ncbi:MAG: hypothetical protein ACT4OX_02965 [Actinomycetota bacterium]
MLIEDEATPETDELEVTTARPGFPDLVRWLPPVIGVVVLVIALMAVIGPLRHGGFIGDDAINVLFRDSLRETDSSVWEHMRFYTRDWMEKQGRFFPGAIAEGSAVWWFLDDRAHYEAFQILVVALDLALLALLIRQVSRQWPPAFIAVALALSSIQFRLFHDAVLSLSGLLPVVLAAVLGMVLALNCWQVRGDWWLLPIAALLWFFALTSYEIAFFVAPAAVLSFWLVAGDVRRRVVSTAIVVVPTVVLFGVVLSLRDEAEALEPAYTTRFHLSEMLPASIYQFVGAVPGNVPAFRSEPSLGDLFSGHELGSLFLALVVGAAVAVAVTRCRSAAARDRLVLALFGLTLWIAPVVTVAIAQRWQDELGFGLAYLGVYFQSFGFALVGIALLLTAVTAFSRLQTRYVRPSRVAFAVVVGLTAGGLVATTARNNQWVVNAYGRPEGIRQEAVERAARDGLYDALPDGSTLVAADYRAWLIPLYLRANGATTVTTVADPATLTGPIAGAGRCELSSSTYQPPLDLERGGFVVLARPDGVAPPVDPAPAPPIVGSARLRVLVPDREAIPEFSARAFLDALDAPLEVLPGGAVVETVRAGDGVIVDLCLSSSLIDAASLTYR